MQPRTRTAFALFTLFLPAFSLGDDCNENGVLDDLEVAPLALGLQDSGLALPESPSVVFSSDFDGDGDPDVMVGSRHRISYFSTHSSRELNLTASLDTPGTLFNLVVGDIDGDSLPDLVGASGTHAWILQNNALAQFERVDLGLPDGVESTSVALGDVDGDRELDIVASIRNENAILVFRNQGSATFSAGERLELRTPFAEPLSPGGVAISDLDRDGDLDLVLVASGPDEVHFFSNDGDGEFVWSGRLNNLGTVGALSSVETIDFDGDEFPDLVLRLTDEVVLVGNSGEANSIGFDKPRAVPLRSQNVQVADFDSDGNLELVASTSQPQGVVVFRNVSTLDFQIREDTELPFSVAGLTVEDFSGDLLPDVAVIDTSTQSLRILESGRRTRRGSFSLDQVSLPVVPLQNCDAQIGCRPHAGALVDLDGDGDLDLLSCLTNPGAFVVGTNRDGELEVGETYVFGGFATAEGRRPQSVATGDL
ncbi:MAG: FG-GAP-like repeat-containing protein, partial [Planctomycetota bacterium]